MSSNRCELLTVAEMGRADALAVEDGVPSLNLMEAAGAAIARTIVAHWTRCETVVLCGPGNNGGDGFVVARLLREAGWPVRVASLCERSGFKGDAKINAERWLGELEALNPAALDGAALVVDALFGAGLTRPLDGLARATVEAINERKISCVAVDVPSGVLGDTGEVLGAAPRCAVTVTFFRKKPAHILSPGSRLCGQIVLADIGIPDRVLARIGARRFENAPGLWLDGFPWPTADSHKYVRGHALVIGGAEMTGAARLAARAARRIGAGLVTIAAPSAAVPIHRAGDPGQLVIELGDKSDIEKLMSERKRNSVLVGPGNGVGADTRRHAIGALRSGHACVLDADALSVFQDAPADLFGWIEGPCVLTPHEGEFARLFSAAGDRMSRTAQAAALSGAIVILKGSETIVAAPDGRLAVNPAASPWLATGGTGDVLAGFVLGLLAQGMEPFAAACAAVWVHSEAARRFGLGVIAEDLSEEIPAILSALAG